MRRDETLPGADIRTDWTTTQIAELFERPLLDLLIEAQVLHRKHHKPNSVELATLLSIKTGGCPEDCGYCSQSAFASSGVRAEKLIGVDTVLETARQAKEAGASRFCMGAAWRSPKDRDMDAVCAMVEGVKALGLETCMTLGMLSEHQAGRLADAGLDYYNHNLDTSRDYYPTVTGTRTYEDRLETLELVRRSGIGVCCGGILGMGESREDRIGLLFSLATMPRHPESIPINALVPIGGTALGDLIKQDAERRIDDLEFVRTIAVARLLMPASVIRLSAGRESMSESTQALCFMAGANSIFYGDKLLTTRNSESNADAQLLAKLQIESVRSALVEPAPEGRQTSA
jgi:biotin synthase